MLTYLLIFYDITSLSYNTDLMIVLALRYWKSGALKGVTGHASVISC